MPTRATNHQSDRRCTVQSLFQKWIKVIPTSQLWGFLSSYGERTFFYFFSVYHSIYWIKANINMFLLGQQTPETTYYYPSTIIGFHIVSCGLFGCWTSIWSQSCHIGTQRPPPSNPNYQRFDSQSNKTDKALAVLLYQNRPSSSLCGWKQESDSLRILKPSS